MTCASSVDRVFVFFENFTDKMLFKKYVALYCTVATVT